MDFRAEFYPKPFEKKISYTDKLLLVGSCFTEQIGSRLSHFKFKVLDNPNGILFNPLSIARSVTSYAAGTVYSESDLFYHNELWGSWQHHTRFSSIDKKQALSTINDSQKRANSFIREANWLLITLGSAFVYENMMSEHKEVVANCHKVPTDKFYRRLLEIQEVKNALSDMMETVRSVNAEINFIFTISPVRHLREGFIENNRSKATLIQAVHSLVDNERAFYFPAYELVIDDLRDYRFYAEDMVHPNYTATNYVWEKFTAACISDDSRQLMKELNSILAAKHHKPFNPQSGQHRKFLADNLVKTEKLQQAYPMLDLQEELKYFSS